MPIYSYECQGFHGDKGPSLYEAYVPLVKSPTPPCPLCGGTTAEKIWSITHRTGSMIFPYTTTHITGAPLEIKSSRHLSQIEKQYGVRLRDDKDFLDEPMQRHETKAWRERESARKERGKQIIRDIMATSRP